MSCLNEQLDLEQKIMLETVRERLSDILSEEHDDNFLVQFLKARSFHEERTVEMIRTHLRWRKHFGVDYLMKEFQPPKFCKNLLNLSILGFTNEGDIVKIFRLGYSDIKGVLLGNTSLEVETYLAYTMTLDQTLMKANERKTGRSGGKALYIGDFQNIDLYALPWKYALSLIIRLVKLFEANFPEHLKAVYLINCQTVMYWVLKFLKPFMSEVTASKVHIFGTDDYKEVLLEQIDAGILPPFLGGNRCDTEDDKTCTFLETEIEKLPESSYVFRAKRLAVTQSGVVEVKVDRRNSHSVDIEVPGSDYAILWEVDIQDYDLGIGLFYKQNADSEEADSLQCIRPVKRSKAHFSPYVGMHICEHPGTYVLMFDNGYSYFTDKDVLYRVKVIPPKGEQ